MLPPLITPNEMWHDPNAVNRFHQQVMAYKMVCDNLLQIVLSIPVSGDLVENKTIADISLNESIVICDRMLYAMSMPDYNPLQIESMSEIIGLKTLFLEEAFEGLNINDSQLLQPLHPFQPQ